MRNFSLRTQKFYHLLNFSTTIFSTGWQPLKTVKKASFREMLLVIRGEKLGYQGQRRMKNGWFSAGQILFYSCILWWC
jgi:hypothetical protein